MKLNTKIKQYAANMKEIQENLLAFLENDQTCKLDFENINVFLNDHKINQNKHILKDILYIISMISKYHFRTADFFDKLEYIIKLYKDEINKFFTNREIFNIFKNSKRMLLFLFNEKIIIPDQSIFHIISQNIYKQMGYIDYFQPEFFNFLDNEQIDDIESFNQKRKNGENDQYIAQLIRDDSIIEFITYVNKRCISLNSEIDLSIFETNLFLLKNGSATLIEYAAFYGSFQIFKYLQMNNVRLSESLLDYSIHGQNPELFHILESNEVYSNHQIFYKCYIESIKCHHINFMNYIRDNLLNIENDNHDEYILIQCLKYHNFYELSNCDLTYDDIRNIKTFMLFIQYDYYEIVYSFLKETNLDVKQFAQENI